METACLTACPGIKLKGFLILPAKWTLMQSEPPAKWLSCNIMQSEVLQTPNITYTSSKRAEYKDLTLLDTTESLWDSCPSKLNLPLWSDNFFPTTACLNVLYIEGSLNTFYPNTKSLHTGVRGEGALCIL
jgi:hypothetical protein